MKAAGEDGLYAQIAKMELGRWNDVQIEPFLQAVDKINRRNDTSDFELIGLIGVMLRYAEDPSFPAALKKPIEDCVLRFRYWADEPGKDVMWFWSENHQITFHACEILAGQLYPNRTFSNAGKTGAWHREKGEKLALAWLRRRLAGGFHEWDSNTYFSVDMLALSHLADLAASDEVRELAAMVLSKMLFTIAVNSYKGVFGSAHAHLSRRREEWARRRYLRGGTADVGAGKLQRRQVLREPRTHETISFAFGDREDRDRRARGDVES